MAAQARGRRGAGNPPDGASVSPSPRSLSRSQRVTQAAVFREAFEQGRKFHGTYMVMFLRAGQDACLRLGVVTSKRVGNAVKRVRARRRLREAYRQNRDALNGDVDIILVAKAAMTRAKWPEIVSELERLAGQAGLTRTECRNDE